MNWFWADRAGIWKWSARDSLMWCCFTNSCFLWCRQVMRSVWETVERETEAKINWSKSTRKTVTNSLTAIHRLVQELMLVCRFHFLEAQTGRKDHRRHYILLEGLVLRCRCWALLAQEQEHQVLAKLLVSECNYQNLSNRPSEMNELHNILMH